MSILNCDDLSALGRHRWAPVFTVPQCSPQPLCRHLGSSTGCTARFGVIHQHLSDRCCFFFLFSFFFFFLSAGSARSKGEYLKTLFLTSISCLNKTVSFSKGKAAGRVIVHAGSVVRSWGMALMAVKERRAGNKGCRCRQMHPELGEGQNGATSCLLRGLRDKMLQGVKNVEKGNGFMVVATMRNGDTDWSSFTN